MGMREAENPCPDLSAHVVGVGVCVYGGGGVRTRKLQRAQTLAFPLTLQLLCDTPFSMDLSFLTCQILDWTHTITDLSDMKDSGSTLGVVCGKKRDATWQ